MLKKKKKSESGSTWIRTGSPYPCHYPMPVLHTGHAPHTSGAALMTVHVGFQLGTADLRAAPS